LDKVESYHFFPVHFASLLKQLVVLLIR
jgi:hypothetical protein